MRIPRVYKDAWDASIGEELSCQREADNYADPFAIAIIKDGNIVGHIPRKILMVCLLFLHPYCVSCKILLLPNEGSTNNQASETSKRDPITTVVEKNVEVRPVKIEYDICGQITAKSHTVWIKKGSITLYDHKQIILNDDSKLNDLIINAAQTMLKNQFPELMGFQSTLLLKKPQPRFQDDKLYVQIIFDRGDHWIVAFTLFARSGQVKFYDSLFTTIDKETKGVISNLYGPVVLPCLVSISKQKGGTDCGLFKG